MAGFFVFTLGGPAATKPLCIEAGEHLDPGSAASRGAFRPGVPDRVLDEPVNVFSKAIEKAAAEGVGFEGSHVG